MHALYYLVETCLSLIIIIICYYYYGKIKIYYYKLALGAIANRMKLFLQFLTNNEHTGYVPGRFVGESTPFMT